MKKYAETKLGELVQIKGGGTPSRANPEYWGGEIPWVTVKDFNSKRIVTAQEKITPIGLKNSASNMIPAKSILMPTRMALGKIAINEIPVAINQDIKALQIMDKDKINLEYLSLYLLTISNVFERAGKGSTVKGIKLDFLKDIKIPLPPLDDQIRIAAVLTRAEKLIAKRKESIKTLDELLKSTFLDMFGDIRARKSIHPWEKPRPYLTAQSGKSSKGVLSTMKTDIPIYGGNGINGWATEPLFLEPVVIAGRVGQQCGVIHVSKGPCWVTDNAIVLRIKDNAKLNTIYLAHAFTHSPILEKVRQLDLPFINQSMLLDILIPIPEVENQIKFASIVEKAESLKAKHTKSLAELENLFGSLSQRAFKGELDLSGIPVESEKHVIEIHGDVKVTSSVDGEPSASKIYSEVELIQIIKSLAGKTFSFDSLVIELEKASFEEMPKYKELKEQIYKMLEEPNPLLSQTFDKIKKEIVLRVNI